MVIRKITKNWFAVDGTLAEIDFKGESYFRFPEEVAELVIGTYSKDGDAVLDPFAGFGTTLHVAQGMGRRAIGFEINTERAAFASKNLRAPNRVINAGVEEIGTHDLPQFNLVFTSPPYVTVHLKDDPWGESYFADMKNIFVSIKDLLAPDAHVILEVSNIRTKDGFRPLAWQLGELLSTIFEFQGEVIRCNTSEVSAGPGFNHSYLLVFKNNLSLGT